MPSREFTVIRRFGVARDGHAGIMFSVLALPLILAVGFVLDFAQANRHKSELQNVADAVALAAVRGLPISESTGLTAGRNLYEALMQGIRTGLLTDDLRITFETDPDFKAIVEITATAKGLFGNNINLGTLRFEISAQAILDHQNTEIAMVLDLSGSMNASKVTALGNAMNQFDKTLQASIAASSTARLRIAAVPFAGSVSLPNFGAQWLTDPSERPIAISQGRTCFKRQAPSNEDSPATPGQRTYFLAGSYTDKCIPDSVAPLSDSFAQYRTLAQAIRTPQPWRGVLMAAENYGYGGTALYEATLWAEHTLSPEWTSYWPAGSGALPYAGTNKYAIIMTDGDQYGIDGVTRSQAESLLLNICARMRSNEIRIFTIGFQVSPAAATLLTTCAGGSDHFIRASNSSDLTAAFNQIAGTIGQGQARLAF